MSYTDYILHEKFQIHGASVSLNEEPPTFLTHGELREYFATIDWTKTRLICHNMLFDGAIMYLIYKVVAAKYFCTLAMLDAMYQGAISVGLDAAMKTLLGWETGKTDIIARLKDVRTEDIPPEDWADLVYYANDDLRATIQLYTQYSPSLPSEEHEIMDNILKMFCRPLLEFNTDLILEACQEADDERDALITAALGYGATEEILRGNKLFPEFLESLGYTVPMKLNPKGKRIPALAKTDQGMIDMLEGKDERLSTLARARQGVKSTQAQTRAYRFKKMDAEVGKFMAAYNYARAHTWRVTGGNKINAANLKRGSKLRLCIEAIMAHVLAVADASQIECRSTGYLAGQEDLMQLFRDKRDPYNEMAGDIFGRVVDRKGNPDDFLEGFIGKTATLGLGFGMGGEKFQATVIKDAKQHLDLDIDFSRHEADRIVYDVYRPKNWKIKDFWDVCTEMLYHMLAGKNMTWDYGDGTLEVNGAENKIYFPNGTWLYYPGLDNDNGQFTYLNHKVGGGFFTKKIYGALLTENIVQKFARDITSHHLVKIAERYPVVMHTYDENIAMVPEEEAEEATEWMIDLMCVPPSWAASLPLDAEGGYAKEYSK